MATRYTFTDDSGDVRISGFLTPEPAGTFNGGTITTGITVHDGAAADFTYLYQAEVTEGFVFLVDGGGEVNIHQRDATAYPLTISGLGGGTWMSVASDGSIELNAPGGLGFFGVGPVAQQVLVSGTATPEQIALALQATGLAGGT